MTDPLFSIDQNLRMVALKRRTVMDAVGHLEHMHDEIACTAPGCSPRTKPKCGLARIIGEMRRAAKPTESEEKT